MYYLYKKIFDKQNEPILSMCTNLLSVDNEEGIRDIVDVLKKEYFLYTSKKYEIKEPKIKNGEVMCFDCTSSDSVGLTIWYIYFCDEGTMMAGTSKLWSKKDPDQYTDFILDMKRWIKNQINPDMGNLDKLVRFEYEN